MIWLLDTNICIYLLNGNDQLKQKIGKIGINNIAVSNAVLAELYYGAYNSSRVKSNLVTIETFRKHLTIFHDSIESARLFGKIKADLKKQGNPVEDFDVLIASIAIANDCTLVTHNSSHFSRISGILIDDWFT